MDHLDVKEKYKNSGGHSESGVKVEMKLGKPSGGQRGGGWVSKEKEQEMEIKLLLDPQGICCPPDVCSEDAKQSSSNTLLFKEKKITKDRGYSYCKPT